MRKPVEIDEVVQWTLIGESEKPKFRNGRLHKHIMFTVISCNFQPYVQDITKGN